MYKNENIAVCKAAEKKLAFLDKNPGGFFVSSMLAGAYVGFAVILVYTIGGLLDGSPYTKILMGAFFGIALALVIMAGSELFTGNNFTLSVAMLNKKASLQSTLRLWAITHLGNWAGSLVLALLFYFTGLATNNTGQFMSDAAATKMQIPAFQLFVRAILCNVLVSVAVWMSFKMKSESGKLIMIFSALFVFVTSGFEHSVANMTLLSVALLNPMNADLSLTGYFYNILVATAGNIVGGSIFVALPYFLASRKDKTPDPAAEPVCQIVCTDQVLSVTSLTPEFAGR